MILQINNLTFNFGSQCLLQDLNFELSPNERVAIMGANGSGKTSLLRLIIGYYTKYTGEIKYQGQNIKSCSKAILGKEVAYIPQSVEPFPDTRAEQFFNLSLQYNSTPYIQLLQVENLLNRPYKSLSGGEKQRVLLASALTRKPSLIIADELTQAVDTEYINIFGEILTDYCQQNAATLLMVTHDKDWAEAYCKRIVTLIAGGIFEGSSQS